MPASDCALYIDQAIAALDSEPPVLDESELDPAAESDRIALKYLQLVLEGNTADAIELVTSAVGDQRDATRVYLDILLPAQREIGRLWHLGDVTVAEEHLVTSCTQRAMAILANASEHRTVRNGKTAVAAAVAGNAHDIGLRAVADLYQIAGWRSIFLGSDVPARDMPATLTFFEADVLLLAATLSTQIPRVSEAIQLVRDRCERPVKIILGGAAFDEAPDLWQRMGSDGYAASADEAVRIGAKLVGS